LIGGGLWTVNPADGPGPGPDDDPGTPEEGGPVIILFVSLFFRFVLFVSSYLQTKLNDAFW